MLLSDLQTLLLFFTILFTVIPWSSVLLVLVVTVHNVDTEQTAGIALLCSIEQNLIARQHICVNSAILACILPVLTPTTLASCSRRRFKTAVGQGVLKAQLELQLAT